MPLIEVSDQHLKALEGHSPFFKAPEVLAGILSAAFTSGLPKGASSPTVAPPVVLSSTTPKTPPVKVGGWVHLIRNNKAHTRLPIKSITIPVGTEFQGEGGKKAVASKDGLVYDGNTYDSFSKAAQVATGAKSKNGWAYWEFRFTPEHQWEKVEFLRNTLSPWGTPW